MMNAELSEQFMRILFFIGGALMFFFVLMNADAVVDFTDGALFEWNAYIVATHLLLVCGCGIAWLISRRTEKAWLITVLVAPLAVNLLCRFAAGCMHLEQELVGALAFSLITLASLPIVAISAAFVAWQQRLWEHCQRHDSGASAAEPGYLISVTAGGGVLGMAFYTILVQPDAYLTDMLYFAWVSYAVVFMSPAVLFTAALPSNAPLSEPPPPAGISRLDLKKDAAECLLLGGVASFLLIAVQPGVTSTIPSLGHAYVLPLSVATLALAVAFARPPQPVRQVLLSAAPWMSAIGVLIFAVSIYINRYGSAVAAGYLLSLFGVTCACYVGLARLRQSFERLSMFYLTASAGALIGAGLAELVVTALDRMAFPIACALILGCLIAKRIRVKQRSANSKEKTT